MTTIKEHINNLVESNAKHIAELKNEEEVKQWLNSLLWAVAGFKSSINEDELDVIALPHVREYIKNHPKSLVSFTDGFKIGFRIGSRTAKED